jgi:hypothetical protein
VYTRSGGLRTTFGDFVCAFCHSVVPAGAALSGVHHRNHCPYCLYSRHLDLYCAGDRLSACKGHMRPIGLTLKHVTRKYEQEKQGELMLIHECESCGVLSINRMAADDFNTAIMGVFEAAAWDTLPLRAQMAAEGIVALQRDDAPLVLRRLYGWAGVPDGRG